MDLVDSRFLVRKEKWGSVLQDIKTDRIWATKEPNVFQKYKEKLFCNNPYKYEENFLLGNFSNIDELDLEAPISLSWEITNKCNSKCSFCCNDSGIGENELEFKEIKKIVEEINKWDCMRLIIGGGEPLVRKDIIQILKLFEKEKNKPAIATNGILLDENIIKQISKSCITLQISLDSLKRNVYKKLRGIDALDKVKANIKLSKKYIDNIRIVTVLNRYNEQEINEIYEFIKENKINQWFVFNLLPSGRGATNYKELYIENLNNVKEKIKTLKEKDSNVAIWYWGESNDDGTAIYILPDGTLSISDYLKNTRVQLSKEKINIQILKQKWKEIDSKSKIATLKNFTSANEIL